jgi:hypothetical protein
LIWKLNEIKIKLGTLYLAYNYLVNVRSLSLYFSSPTDKQRIVNTKRPKEDYVSHNLLGLPIT